MAYTKLENRPTCKKCEVIMRRSYMGMCWKCYRKTKTRMPNMLTLEEALNKTYEIKTYNLKSKYIRPHITLPLIMVGRKVKLVLVE